MTEFEDLTVKLISAVRKHPSIYNPELRNPHVTEESWLEIGDRFNLTADQAKLKWRNIRENYVREQKLYITGQIKRDDIKNPNFHLLRFLDPFIRRKQSLGKSPVAKKDERSFKRKRSDNIALRNEILLAEPPPEFSIAYLDEQTVSETSWKADVEEEDSNFATNSMNDTRHVNASRSCNTDENENADDLFCKMISLSLRTLGRVNNMRAKKEILQVLEKYFEIEDQK